MIRFTNTLSGEKEEFKPLRDNTVGMYNCGPTVYDHAHIGNLRSYVMADLIRRTLESDAFEVTQIVNVTDIGHLTGDADDSGEDKMIKGLKREGKPITIEAMRELADFYTEKFLEDIEALNIKTPSKIVKASEHIADQIELINKLESKGLTYQTSDGIYFDTARFPEYGKLGNINIAGLKEGARVQKSTEKRNPTDFVLWKFSAEGHLGFESPWGKGYPGWHIECSAMSMKYLGDSFDIHTGGIDHIPVHHNNEIAQSESVSGKPLAHFWLHNEFVNVPSGKMAKSGDNFITLQTLKDRGIHPLAYRYWLLTAHYRSPSTFTWEAVAGSHKTLEDIIMRFPPDISGGKPSDTFLEQFREKISDDLNTPGAIALLHDFLAESTVSEADKLQTLLEADALLGLDIENLRSALWSNIPDEITTLIAERDTYRREEKWSDADAIRDKIQKKGFTIIDTKDGSVPARTLASLISQE